MIKKESVDFVALQETLISEDASGVVNAFWSTGDYAFSQIGVVGRSGGILRSWRKDCFNAVSAFAGRGFLCVEGFWKGCSQTLSIINVYAPQDDSDKRKLWLDICSYLSNSSKLFCLMGDFNSVRNEGERFGCTFHQRREENFNAFIKVTDLQELHMGGRRFTWIGPGGLKLSKLDRFLMSRELSEIWIDMAVVALDRCFSDHCPHRTQIS